MDTLTKFLMNGFTVESNNAYKKDIRSMSGNLVMVTLTRSSSHPIRPWWK